MILDSSAVAPVPAHSEHGTHQTAASNSVRRKTKRNSKPAPSRSVPGTPVESRPAKTRRQEFIRMAELLQRFQTLPTEAERQRERNEFYDLFVELTKRDAYGSLRARGCHDPAEDAKDIAQARAIVLARQESRGSGMFQMTSLGQRALEGYIRRAIQRGAYRAAERLVRMRTSRGIGVPLDAQVEDADGFFRLELPAHTKEILMEIAAKSLFERLKERVVREHKRQSAGTTPIEWVLAVAKGEAIQPPKGSPRTVQRRIAEVRTLISRGLAGETISL